jgi:hypothetical protein
MSHPNLNPKIDKEEDLQKKKKMEMEIDENLKEIRRILVNSKCID